MSQSDQQWRAQFQREQLHRAAANGDLEQVEALLAKKYPINRFDELGKTPLHHAVQGGHLAVVERLLEARADVNAHDERVIGNTPLSDNIDDCSYEMAELLIRAGADPTIPGWMHLTAIHRAEGRKDANARKILRLLHGAVRSTNDAQS